MDNSNQRGGFTSHFGALTAATGSAIGLGNIWRFPYTAGENGGGAFLIIYLLFVFLIGMPIMMSELVIGRRSQRNAFGAFKTLTPQKKSWSTIGIFGIITAFLIYCFYSVVAGWTLKYVGVSLHGGFAGKDPAAISNLFSDFIKNPVPPIVCQFAFIVLTGFVVMMGIQKGIEKCTKILMPILFILMIILCIRSVTLEGSGAGLRFLFKPDFSKLTGLGVLNALGQALFSLSCGMGLLITYGSYIRKDDNLLPLSISIATADTMVAILAGVAIFPAVFAFGLSPTSGPSLVFEVIPNVFNNMTAGGVFSVAFFILLSIAALTSTISMLEIPVLWMVEELHLKRVTATILSSLTIFAVGSLCSLSFGVLSHATIFGLTIFEAFDKLTATYLMPMIALAITIYFGWFLPKVDVKDELSNQGRLKSNWFNIYYFIIKYIAPIALAIVLITGIIGVGK